MVRAPPSLTPHGEVHPVFFPFLFLPNFMHAPRSPVRESGPTTLIDVLVLDIHWTRGHEMKTRAWRQRPTAMAPFQRHRVRREKRSKCACYRLVVKTTTCELLVHSLALGSRPQRLACFILAGLAIHPVNFPIRSCHQAPIPALAMPAVHSKWNSMILNALVRPGIFPYPTLVIHEHHKSINNHPGHLSRSISTLFPDFFLWILHPLCR